MKKITVFLLVVCFLSLIASCPFASHVYGATPPKITAASPENNATDVAVDTVVEITFDKSLPSFATSIIAQRFSLTDSAGAKVSADVTCSGATCTLTPSANLSYGATYTTKALRYEWSFSTAAETKLSPKLYVANSGELFVSVIDTNNSNSVSSIYIGDTNCPSCEGGNPVNITTIGQMAYTANEGGTKKVSVISTAEDKLTSSIDAASLSFSYSAAWIAVNNLHLYLSYEDKTSVDVIDSTNNTLLTTIPGVTDSTRFPGFMLWNADTNELYTLNRNKESVTNDTVSVIDTGTNAIKATITVGAGPYGAVVDSSANVLYVANAWSHNISVIDLATYAVTTISFDSGTYPAGVEIIGNYLYVTAAGKNEVWVVDKTSYAYAIVKKIVVGTEPVYFAKTGDSKTLYVTNYKSNSVSVIDTATNAVTATIGVGSGPVGLAIWEP